MNLVIDESTEFKKDGTKNSIGMVVVRGNSVVMLEAKDRVWGDGDEGYVRKNHTVTKKENIKNL